MNYSDGTPAALGDRVKLWELKIGTIVCSIDDDQYAPEFSRESWAHKRRGVVVKTDDGEIFYYDEPDEDFMLLERASHNRIRRLG